MKMSKLSLVLAFLALAVAPVLADVAVGSVGAGAAPGNQEPVICVYEREVIVDGINTYEMRASQYAFTGEVIKYYFVVRDVNGALDIGHAFAKVTSGNTTLLEVVANPVELPDSCDGLGKTDERWDKAFEVTITVEPTWYDWSEIVLTVEDSHGMLTDSRYSERWFFNPAISLDVRTTDGQPIHFEPLPDNANNYNERWVHSVNKLLVTNDAEGGVNLWVFIAATDFTDPEGPSKCPTTNVLSVDNLCYRAQSGTFGSGQWYAMYRYDEDASCNALPGICYAESPKHPVCTDAGTNGVPADLVPESNILTNGGTMEIEFKLHYPMPCIGNFEDGRIYVFGKAI